MRRTNFSESLAHFEKSISIFKEVKAENELAKAFSGVGHLYKMQRDITKAREYFTKALEIFERLGTLIHLDKVKALLSSLPSEKD